VPDEVVIAVIENCWLQQKVPMPVEDDGQESPCNSWGEAMARTLWVVGHAISMPLDACESPAQACTRSAESDELFRIDKASMVGIVAEPQATVQAFYVPHRSGGLSLTDGGLVFRCTPSDDAQRPINSLTTGAWVTSFSQFFSWSL
jgi:hypothetical protein